MTLRDAKRIARQMQKEQVAKASEFQGLADKYHRFSERGLERIAKGEISRDKVDIVRYLALSNGEKASRYLTLSANARERAEAIELLIS